MEQGGASVQAEVAELWRRLAGRFDERPRDRDDAVTAPPAMIEHATRVFRLQPIERDVLVFLLGVALGQTGAKRPREVRLADVVDVLGAGDARVGVLAALDDSATLAGHALVTVRGDGPRLDRTIALADGFWPRLVGVRPDEVGVRLAAPELGLDELALAPDVAARVHELRRRLATALAGWPTVIVHGTAGTGRGALAAALAATLGIVLLVLDGTRLRAATLPSWRREIAWHQAAPVITDADQAEPAALSALVRLAASPLFLTTSSPSTERVLAPMRAIYTLAIDRPTVRARAQIWSAALLRAGAPLPMLYVDALAARLQFAPGRIAAAAVAIVASGAPSDEARAVELCRSIPEVRVGGLATRLDARFGWDDLVVPAAVRAELELIVTWGRRGAILFARDGIGGRARAPRGLACLFHGPPGTGKTLAAQVIASELGLDLYRVDLAQVVDKYIGETEKRLDLLFREAEAAGVVLFFDEADALFTQRTEVREARDRYANLETGFLLQRLEDHRGLTILASNLQRNLDSAFQRRLGVIVELPAPSPVERLRIWEKLLPLPGQRDPDIDLELIARRVALAGGDIRNAVFAAILLADRAGELLAMRHVALAIRREMSKAGRLFDPTELGPSPEPSAQRAGVVGR